MKTFLTEKDFSRVDIAVALLLGFVEARFGIGLITFIAIMVSSFTFVYFVSKLETKNK